jgi:thiol-disulfide isomerase/thioredoxin
MNNLARRLSIFSMAAGVVLLAALIGCQKASQTPAASGTDAGTAAAPEGSVVLTKLDGTTTTVDQYKGKVVLVNFWATWCDPCKIEIPWLIDFNNKYGPKGLVILGVSMDDEGKKVVEPFVNNQNFEVNGHQERMNYPILLGDDKIADKFGGLIGMPTSFLFSRDGKKVKTVIGLISYDELDKALQAQL